MARDDMFSWLTEGKKPKQNAASSPDEPKQPPPQEPVLLKQPPIAQIGEQVSAIVSAWVNSSSQECNAASSELHQPSQPAREPAEPHPSNEESLQSEQFVADSSSIQDTAIAKHTASREHTENEQEQETVSLQNTDEYIADETFPQNTATPAPNHEFSQDKQDNFDAPKAREVTDETLLPINEQQRILDVLTKVRQEPKPIAGMAALELAPPRLRRASVVAVKAGGRRVMAQIRDVGRIYTYTLRPDKTYRLEGVTTKNAPRLILDVDV